MYNRWTHVTKGGAEIIVDTISVDEFDGGRIAIVKDVTALVAAEQALIESEQTFNTLANSMPLLAWMAEPDGSVIWYNARWYEYTGTTEAEMLGDGWKAVHDPDRVGSVWARWQRALEVEAPFEMGVSPSPARRSLSHFPDQSISVQGRERRITALVRHLYGCARPPPEPPGTDAGDAEDRGVILAMSPPEEPQPLEQFTRGAFEAADRRLNFVHLRLGQTLDAGPQKSFFGREIDSNSAVADTCLSRDVDDAGLLKPALREQPHRRVEDLLATFGRPPSERGWVDHKHSPNWMDIHLLAV
jgi:hypothetical protein